MQEVTAASHGDAAGAGHFEDAVGAEDFKQAVDFVRRTRDFDNQGFGSDVDNATAENLDEFHQVRARFLVRRDFDQGEVTFEDRAFRNVFGEKDVHEFFEAGFESMRTAFVGVRDDRHSRHFFIFCRSYGQ